MVGDLAAPSPARSAAAPLGARVVEAGQQGRVDQGLIQPEAVPAIGRVRRTRYAKAFLSAPAASSRAARALSTRLIMRKKPWIMPG